MYTCTPKSEDKSERPKSTPKSEDKSERPKSIQVRLYSCIVFISLRSYVLNFVFVQSRNINLHFE